VTGPIRAPLRLATGLVLPGLGLGCMGLTEFYGDDSRRADPAAVIDRAIALGLPFLDTADAYGPWRNEEAVGLALAGRRDQVILATKFGVVRRQDQGDGIQGDVCGRPDYVRQCCESSLKRLRTDRIDLYLMHRPDPATPIEDTTGALAELVREGKIRFIGFCEIGPQLLRRAHAVHPVSVVQSEFSLWHRDPAGLLPHLAEIGAALVAYSPLGRGFLSGRIRSPEDLAPDDWRRQSPRFQGENFWRNLAIVDQLGAMARERRCTAAQLALGWLRAQSPAVVPLNGATTPEELADSAGCLDMALTADELALLDKLVPTGAAAGQSWPEGSVGARVGAMG
jgi:aryl-alcohol dehydrogenase-like predicted oxidoreductase